MPDLGEALLHGAATALRKLAAQDDQPYNPTRPAGGSPVRQRPVALVRSVAGEWRAIRRTSSRRAARRRAPLPVRLPVEPVLDNPAAAPGTTPHMSDDHFARLEATIMAYAPPWESRNHAGWASFILLSAMAKDRLSDTGMQGSANCADVSTRTSQPSLRQRCKAGFQSPIPQASAKLMTDDRWLSAMDKHRTDQTDFGTLTGGVHELSGVLRSEAANDPTRFARLALRMTADTHPSYVNAILEALMQTQNSVDATLVFDVVRHVAALGNDDTDQALTMALRQHLAGDVPDDITELVLDRALHATDPTEEAWSKLAPGGQPYYNGDIATNGMNCARGQAALILGDLLIHDADGRRTRLVAPSLAQLADDPSVAVRSSVAHVLGAAFRHAAEEALAAFELLIATDDRLLATSNVFNLMLYIGTGRPAVVEPVIQRMLASPTRESSSGRLPCSARRTGIRARAPTHGGPRVRRRAHPPGSGRPLRPELALHVRCRHCRRHPPAGLLRRRPRGTQGGAQVVAGLRNHPLQPFHELLATLVASPPSPRRCPSCSTPSKPHRIASTKSSCSAHSASSRYTARTRLTFLPQPLETHR